MKKKDLHILLEVDTYKKIEKLADKENRSRSNLVSTIVSEFLEKRGKK